VSFLFAESNTKSVSLAFYSLSNILCKHLFYIQARVKQQEPLFSSFICQFLLRCQNAVKSYRHIETAIHELMCSVGYPENTRLACTPGHKRDQPVSLLSRVPGPRINLDSKPPHLRPGLNVVLRLSPILASNQSVRKELEPMTRE
jgi:hypothetical protein